MISKISNNIDSLVRKIKNVLPSFAGGPLTNKWFLYIVFAGALYELFLYFMRYDFYAISIFLLIGFLASFFSKNMVVIMIMAIVFTRLLRYGQKLSEGFADADKENEDKEDEEEEKEDEDEEDAPSPSDKDKTKKTTDKTEQMETKENFEEPSAMSDTTQKLLQNQKQLMANMEALKPVLKQAEQFLAASNEKKMETFTTLAKAY